MKLILGEKQPKKWRGVNLLLATTVVAEPPQAVKNETSGKADLKLTDTQFFVAQKLSSLHTAGNVCMTWWVSSVVFCGTILAAVWLQRDHLRQSAFMKWVLLVVLTAFFAGVAGFGYLVIKYLEKFRNDLNGVAGGTVAGADTGRLFYTELEFFISGMWIGTISFALILMAWISFWLGLWWFDCCRT